MRLVLTPIVVALAAWTAACGGEDHAADKRAGVAKATRTGACSPLTYGGQGQPQFLVAMVGPLQGPFSDHGIQNSQSTKLVMQRHRWRAGEHKVGIQICDEASAGEPIDVKRCERNARALAGNRSVLAVVGPSTSACAAAMIPLLNRAAGGPVADVGVGNTYLGLTRRGPGVEAGLPDSLYPTGARSYLRTVPADDVQAAAAVIVARDGGASRTFAAYDATAFGKGAARSFQESAARAGLSPVGTAEWDAKAKDYRALALRIRRSRADAVYVAGYITSNGPRLIHDLRAGLGRDVQILAPDGFNQPTAIVEGAGERADGMVITLAAAPASALPAAGRRWAAEFERRWGAKPCCYAVHAGQAMQIVMDAIARSDGTRARVLENLQRTQVRGGLVGDFRFDRYGDTTLTTIAVHRIRGGKLSFERTIEIPPELLTRR
jgi:ABC-type branched-subunit amino acid transport system substrate-binding protein